MALEDRQKRALKAQAHALKPVVILGHKGLHPNLIDEIRSALEHHELIKVKVPGGKDVMGGVVEEILAATGAELIQRIGGIATLYLKNPKRGQRNQT